MHYTPGALCIPQDRHRHVDTSAVNLRRQPGAEPLQPSLFHSLQPARVRRPRPHIRGDDQPTHLVEFIEHRHRRFPVDARISDAHAILEPLRPLRWDVLAPGIDVGLDHNAHDGGLALPELLADIVEHLGLVLIVFGRVSVYLCHTINQCGQESGTCDVREQSIMMDGCASGRAFLAAAAAALTNSAL